MQPLKSDGLPAVGKLPSNFAHQMDFYSSIENIISYHEIAISPERRSYVICYRIKTNQGII